MFFVFFSVFINSFFQTFFDDCLFLVWTQSVTLTSHCFHLVAPESGHRLTCVSSKSQRIHLITCFNSPTYRCPFGSWPGRRHQEHQVVRLCPVGGAQTSQQPDWLLHRWPCGGSQGVVPLQPQTLQAYQVAAWDSKQVSLKDIFQKAAQHDRRT